MPTAPSRMVTGLAQVEGRLEPVSVKTASPVPKERMADVLAALRDLRALRRDKIGFVFQAPYLIPFLDVTDNVALLPMLAGVPNAEARQRALELLTALDVQHRAKAMPSQLSGGEQQRVAIARGLVNRPPVILADEPTAPLDSERALAVIRILNDMARQFQTAVIVVTHDEKIIPTFKRIYHIRDGVTTEEVGEGRAIG